MTSAAPTAPGTPVRRLQPGEAVHLDVEFCDLVPPNEPGEDYAVRFKGREVQGGGRTGRPIRVFVDLEMIRGPLERSGLLRGPLPALPAGDTVAQIGLTRQRLTLRRAKSARGATWYEIDHRTGVPANDATITQDFQWAMAEARNAIAPLFEQDRVPYGAAELLTIAGQLFQARRADRRRRE